MVTRVGLEIRDPVQPPKRPVHVLKQVFGRVDGQECPALSNLWEKSRGTPRHE